MCGRYALAQEHEALRIRFGFIDDPSSPFRHTPRYNIAPTQISPVVTQGKNRELQIMRWGFVPHWAKDSSIGNKLINARSETVSEKPSFRDSFREKRCLVPSTGFFEWKKQPGSRSKQPMLIRITDREIFAFAGLWSVWNDPPTGKELHTFTILTTEPNDFMKPIHNRMPVILRPEAEESWVDPSSDPADLEKLFSSYPSELMDAYNVSNVVNSPGNDTPECIAPLSDSHL
jgi:putative SOS response-associated peptidase YedK